MVTSPGGRRVSGRLYARRYTRRRNGFRFVGGRRSVLFLFFFPPPFLCSGFFGGLLLLLSGLILLLSFGLLRLVVRRRRFLIWCGRTSRSLLRKLTWCSGFTLRRFSRYASDR